MTNLQYLHSPFILEAFIVANSLPLEDHTPTGAPSPSTCHRPPPPPPQDPQQKCSPPMTHKLANDVWVGPVNQVNHTGWEAIVTPTDRPKSVRNRSVFELFCGVVCVVILPFDISVGVGAFVIGPSQISSLFS